MKVKFFSETDTAYVEFTEKDISETKEISENIYIDMDADKKTIDHSASSSNATRG